MISNNKVKELRESFKETPEVFAESLGLNIETYLRWEEKGITDFDDLVEFLPLITKGREAMENKIILNFVNIILESLGDYDYMKRLAILFTEYEYSATKETLSQSERDLIRFKLSNTFLEFMDKMIDDRNKPDIKRRKKGVAT